MTAGTVARSGTRTAPPPLSQAVLVRMSTLTAWLVFLAGHAVFGVIASRSAALATAHMAVVLLSVVVVGTMARSPEPILAITAYAGVSDVLWRSTSAQGPYEGAKYAIILGFACITFRFLRRPRNGGLGLVILLCLVPGVIVTLGLIDLSAAREQVSANLAGVVAIVVAAVACSNLAVTTREVRGLYLAVLGPITALSAAASWATVTASELEFTDEVNFTSAGGFGPNQVSPLLAMGTLLCILVALQPRVTKAQRLVALGTGTWLVGQAVLTFSRGGLYGLVIALACVGLVALGTSGQRGRTLVLAGFLVLIAIQMLSWAGAFTDGASDQRLSSTDSTRRIEIAQSELELFAEHPIWGVGAGRAKFERDLERNVSAHTEYTRMVAEHGVFGLVALGAMGVLLVRILRPNRGWYRVAGVGLVVLALTQMTHSATRIGCIAVAVGLAALREDPG